MKHSVIMTISYLYSTSGTPQAIIKDIKQDGKRQCFEEFPEKLSTLKNTKLDGKSIEELQKIWSEIEYIMGAKQNLKMAVGGAVMGVNAVEDLVVQFTPLNSRIASGLQ
jgi:ribosomal protein L10